MTNELLSEVIHPGSNVAIEEIDCIGDEPQKCQDGICAREEASLATATGDATRLLGGTIRQSIGTATIWEKDGSRQHCDFVATECARQACKLQCRVYLADEDHLIELATSGECSGY